MYQFKKIVPVLRVAQMDRALQFYTSLLGFERCWHSPGDGDGENALLLAGTVALMLTSGTHLGEQTQFTGSLYLDIENIRELWDRLKDQVSIVWPLEWMDYGQWEFGIRDPDGYLLTFAEEGQPHEQT